MYGAVLLCAAISYRMWISDAGFVIVALMWIVPDLRIESRPPRG